MRHPSTLFLAAALLAASACASGSGRSANPYSADMGERKQVQIDIQNDNFSDASIWVVVRGSRQKRLGTVTGKSSASFKLNWTFTEPLRLQLDFVAGPKCTTRALQVDPGDVLQLQIAVDMSQMYDWCR